MKWKTTKRGKQKELNKIKQTRQQQKKVKKNKRKIRFKKMTDGK